MALKRKKLKKILRHYAFQSECNAHADEMDGEIDFLSKRIVRSMPRAEAVPRLNGMSQEIADLRTMIDSLVGTYEARLDVMAQQMADLRTYCGYEAKILGSGRNDNG